jgi:hypothetical protein
MGKPNGRFAVGTGADRCANMAETGRIAHAIQHLEQIA